ncbi:MAG TPA: glycosyltransferase family 4 protein [Opitutaceae bacterium]
MSVILFQPSVAPFVQQAARALHEAGLLEAFCTTLARNPREMWQRSAARLSQSFDSKLQRRIITEVPLEKTVLYPWRELLRLTIGSLDRSGKLTDLLWERGEIAFSRHVARMIGPQTRALYGYEFCAADAFIQARALGRKTFYDVPAPSPEYVEHLLRAELDRFPELRTPYTRHIAKREARRTTRRKREWDLATHVIAASTFTRDSFSADGRDVSKLHVLPYGAPPIAPRDEVLSRRDSSSRLSFVWAGTFSIRKGAHYLLEAWRGRKLGQYATLDIYGSVIVPDRLVQPAPEGVRFHGPVARANLLKAFQRADALVFPTLCDGFGMVVTEAWSQGLPVILTPRAGSRDLLRAGENGFSVAAGDASALADQLETLIANPQTLAPMRECALQTAASWQWSDYRAKLTEIVTAELG